MDRRYDVVAFGAHPDSVADTVDARLHVDAEAFRARSPRLVDLPDRFAPARFG